jgi:hypothetical protein
VVDGRHSSTKREVLAQRLALKELLRTHSRQVRGRQVQIWGDNQAAIADCKRMRGCPLVLEEVRKLYLLAWGHQLRLSFVWQPRSQRDLVRADLLSKRTDPSDWRLSRKFAREQIFPQLGWPDVDCFASQEAHQVETYYAAVWDGKCKAVDGWAQNWAGWPEGIGLPRRRLCFVFPPVHKVGEALSKINREMAEAILVCPVRPTSSQSESPVGESSGAGHRQTAGGPSGVDAADKGSARRSADRGLESCIASGQNRLAGTGPAQWLGPDRQGSRPEMGGL